MLRSRRSCAGHRKCGHSSGSHLHGVLRKLPLQIFRKQRQVLASQIDEGPNKLAQDLKIIVDPTFITAPVKIVGRYLGYGAPQRTHCLVIQTLPGCSPCRGGGHLLTTLPNQQHQGKRGVRPQLQEAQGKSQQEQLRKAASEDPTALKSYRKRQKRERLKQGKEQGTQEAPGSAAPKRELWGKDTAFLKSTGKKRKKIETSYPAKHETEQLLPEVRKKNSRCGSPRGRQMVSKGGRTRALPPEGPGRCGPGRVSTLASSASREGGGTAGPTPGGAALRGRPVTAWVPRRLQPLRRVRQPPCGMAGAHPCGGQVSCGWREAPADGAESPVTRGGRRAGAPTLGASRGPQPRLPSTRRQRPRCRAPAGALPSPG